MSNAVEISPLNEPMPKAAAMLQNLSILWYCVWLLLPAVQCLTHAVTGLAALPLFAAGVLLDTRWSLQHWKTLLTQGLCMAVLPLCMKFFCGRGADLWGFLAAAILFFFPLIYASHAIQRDDGRLTRNLKPILLILVTLTVCTTIGWLIQGMLRGGRIYAYSRSLGYAGDADSAAYLKELMLRNIGGYDFVYAVTAALPLTFLGIVRLKSGKRILLMVLYLLQTAMIVLSQYTYATIFAAVILWVELIALLIHKLSRNRLSTGIGMLIACIPFVILFLLRNPLTDLAIRGCTYFGLENFANSFKQLRLFLQGADPGSDSRLAYYQTALRGFAESPLFGSMFSGEKQIGGHSDILDLLSGMGLVGTTAVGLLLWFSGKPLYKAIHRTQKETRAHLRLSILCVAATALLGTVIYSREIVAVTALGMLLIIGADHQESDTH